MTHHEPQRLDRLADLAKRFGCHTSFANVARPRAGTGALGNLCVPASPELDELVHVAYEDGWVLREFDWVTWKTTSEAAFLSDDSQAIERATIVQLARILTTLIRQDRFVAGTLLTACQTGLLRRILSRIDQLAKERSAIEHPTQCSSGNTDALQSLRDAIAAYDFPPITYDFVRNRERVHPGMRELERAIVADLLSIDMNHVRNGLSNVLYWGFGRMGVRDHRVDAFRSSVADDDLAASRACFAELHGPGLQTLYRLRLPQFSQISFLSKLRMFLSPSRYVTLDLKLARLRDEPAATVLDNLVVRTSIPVTKHNERVYAAWCATCRELAVRLDPSGAIRAADVERGIFFLVDSGRASVAASVLASASPTDRPLHRTAEG